MTHALRIGLVVLVLGAAFGCGRESAPARLERDQSTGSSPDAHKEEGNELHLSDDIARDLRISTTPVAERTGAQEVSVLGEVVPDQRRYAQVVSPIRGHVVRVLVDLDSTVARGAPIVELRSTELGRARADRLQAAARRDLAQQTADRKRMLASERIVAARELQEAEAALRAAEAEARAAEAGLRALGVSDDDAEGGRFWVRSPISGRVVERRAVLGQSAETDTALFVVADLSTVWVVVQAFERDAVNVRRGSTGHVTLAALPGREFDGRVTQVGRQVDAGSRTVAVRIELPNRDGTLRPGMSATARIEVAGASRPFVAVPAAALQRVGDGWVAFVPKSSREFEMRSVGRGRDLGGEVEVVSGLAAGETVVVEGAFLLKAEAEKRRGGRDEHGH